MLIPEVRLGGLPINGYAPVIAAYGRGVVVGVGDTVIAGIAPAASSAARVLHDVTAALLDDGGVATAIAEAAAHHVTDNHALEEAVTAEAGLRRGVVGRRRGLISGLSRRVAGVLHERRCRIVLPTEIRVHEGWTGREAIVGVRPQVDQLRTAQCGDEPEHQAEDAQNEQDDEEAGEARDM